jgi:hypothetical protein
VVQRNSDRRILQHERFDRPRFFRRGRAEACSLPFRTTGPVLIAISDPLRAGLSGCAGLGKGSQHEIVGERRRTEPNASDPTTVASLVDELRDHVRYLERQVEEEHEARRRADMLLARLVEHV